jgi:hypothetical protein
VRTAVILYLVAVAVLSAFEVARIWLAALPPEQATLTGLYLGAGLDALAPVMAVLSPAAHAAHVFERVTHKVPVGTSSHALMLTVASLLAGCLLARMRGTSR